MANKPLNIYMTNKELIEVIAKEKLTVKDGALVAVSKRGERIIPVAQTCLLYMDFGSSISSEAAILSARHGAHVCAGRGQSYIHSIWGGGRWQDPRKVVAQVKAHSNERLKLQFAKALVEKKIANSQPKNGEDIKKIRRAISHEQLLGYEAAHAKRIYADLANQSNHVFKRDVSAKIGINATLSTLNGALYALMTAIIYNYGMHPSIGFVHGKSRRGGLAFDLADIYKYKYSLLPAFKLSEKAGHHPLKHLSRQIQADKKRLLKDVIGILDAIYTHNPDGI